MAAFLVDRTANLHGKGVQSGQWFWEELQLCDSVQAQATVEYQVQVIEGDRDGDDTSWQNTISRFSHFSKTHD